MYTIKVWHTESDYNLGNSEFDCTNPDMDKAIDYAIATLNYVYAVEVYETESGETVYHSEE